MIKVIKFKRWFDDFGEVNAVEILSENDKAVYFKRDDNVKDAAPKKAIEAEYTKEELIEIVKRCTDTEKLLKINAAVKRARINVSSELAELSMLDAMANKMHEFNMI